MNCKKCGAPLNAEDKFCRNCGATVGEEIAQPNNQDLSNNNNRLIFDNQSNNMQSNVNNLGNYAQPTNNNIQNNNSSRNVILIVLGVVVIILIVVLAIFAIMKFTGKNNDSINNNPGTNENTTGIPTNNTSSYKVAYGKFTFTIPDTMEYEVKNDNLLIGDLDGTWYIELQITNGSYNTLRDQRYSLTNLYSNSGIVVGTPELKTTSGQEYITMEMSSVSSNEKVLGIFTQIDPSNIGVIIGVTQNMDIDYSILDKITPIIKSATYNNGTSSMEVTNEFNVDIDKITYLAQ